MKPLIVHPIQTDIFHARGNLLEFITQMVPNPLIREEMILAVTSKIVSLAEGRLVARQSVDKKTLIQRESDKYLGEAGYGCHLTVKNGLLIPSAGVDESNSENGDYILYPEDPFRSAEKLWHELRKIWSLKKMGIVMTDSKTSPLRRGVTGICLSHAGFLAVRNLVGTPDLFGRDLRMSQMNHADGLAGAAVMVMGEGAEARPLAVIENAEVEFSETFGKKEIQIPLEDDLYFPFFESRF